MKGQKIELGVIKINLFKVWEDATEMIASSNWSRFSEACRPVPPLSVLVEVQSQLYRVQLYFCMRMLFL